MKRIAIAFLIIQFVSCCETKKEASSDFKFLPKNEDQRIISDYASLLSQAEVDAASMRLISYEEKTTNQIAIATVDSIFPYTSVLNYAVNLGNFWGVGRKDLDNGLTIVISRFDRKVGIATGYGTEKILTDSICQVIIDKQMEPQFEKGNFYEGFDAALDEIILQWTND